VAENVAENVARYAYESIAATVRNPGVRDSPVYVSCAELRGLRCYLLD
jgi:hypothetical protein